jgi:uncharacterized protein involved in exopolysaccharide biosynthesis
MSGPGVRQSTEPLDRQMLEPSMVEHELAAARERQADLLRLLWDRRRFLMRAAGIGLALCTLIAFLIPKTYTSTARLMPPDSQSSSALAMVTALAGKTGAGLAGLTGDLLGLKTSGALFIGVLRSETAQDRIIQQFDLKKTYRAHTITDARKKLDENTDIVEDRKSGIITLRVTDHDAKRSAEIGNAYVDELNTLVAQLSTSAAHREREFLEGRLKVAKQDMDAASNQLAQFSSKNNTLDMQIEGKAMLDAAGSLAGQLIAAESQLQGLRQIYTDNNPRVRALNGRVAELRKELQKFGGTEQNSQANSATQPNSSLLNTVDSSADKSASPFPSIRTLPLLGAKYADYYQQTKIQQTVFEMLTEQYELAKVQEAKETPSVKVLDPARVPENKSFPPRLLIISVGTLLAFAFSAVWVLAARAWAAVDPADPRKILALEIATTLQANRPWTSRNGDAPHSWPREIWSRLRNRNQRPPTGGPSGL